MNRPATMRRFMVGDRWVAAAAVRRALASIGIQWRAPDGRRASVPLRLCGGFHGVEFGHIELQTALNMLIDVGVEVLGRRTQLVTRIAVPRLTTRRCIASQPVAVQSASTKRRASMTEHNSSPARSL
jgi:hypothetical protein